MTKLEQAARQALEALEELHYSSGTVVAVRMYESATATLREALAEQAEQEPVAWSVFNPRTGKCWYTHESKYTAKLYASEYSDNALSMEVRPLYAAPVRTKDLTDDELYEFYEGSKKLGILCAFYEFETIARAVIAADRKKNK